MIGAAPVVGEDAVWVPSGAQYNRLLRVDLHGMSFIQIATGSFQDEYPTAAVVAAGAPQAAEALIFGRTASDPFTDTHLRKRAQKAWEAAGLAPIGFHECRHSYRSFLNAAGVDPTRADWYLGHSNHTVSGRYQHALPGQLAKDAETLDGYLTGAADGKVVQLRTGAHRATERLLAVG